MRAGGESPGEGVICKYRKVYRPLTPSTYKETEILEDLNDVIEWVFRYCGRPLKHAKDSLLPRDNLVYFDVSTYAKELENNLKLQGWPIDL